MSSSDLTSGEADDGGETYDSVDGDSCRFSSREAQDCLTKLTSAVENGIVDVATEMAEQLAKMQAAVRVRSNSPGSLSDGEKYIRSFNFFNDLLFLCFMIDF